MIRLRLPFTAALLAGGLLAQTPFVAPSSYATTLGNGALLDLFDSWQPGYPMRVQYLWNTSSLGVSTAAIQGLGFRRPGPGLGNACPQATVAMTVQMSVGPNDGDAVDATFDNNHGANRVTVFSGQVNLPAAPPGPALPPFNAAVTFTQPYFFSSAMGSALVVDFRITGYNATPNDWWIVDGVVRDHGDRFDNLYQPNCLFSNQSASNGIGWYGQYYPGGYWACGYSGLPVGRAGLGFIGFQGVGGNWFGLPLPFDLGPIGAPGCAIATDMLLTQPLVVDQNGDAWWSPIQFPADPSLAFGQFFDHALFVDPGANAAGIATTWSSRWTLGDGTPPPGAKVRLAPWLGEAQGFTDREVPVVEFR